MRQYVYAIFWGALIGFLAYTGLKVVKFKTNTVRLVTAVIIGVSVFTMVGLQVERFSTPPISLATDNGYSASGQFATHFPSPTQIILDSRTITVNSSNAVTGYGSTSPVPALGSIVTGPFIDPGTTLVSISSSSMPGNPHISGLLATISKPLVNMKENIGDIFIYTFTPPAPVAAPRSAPVVSGINITSASYGSNIDPAQVGNRTTVFQGLANGKQAFNTTFDYTATGGDPVPGRAKDLKIIYTCNGGESKTLSIAAEAHSQPISINCQAPVVAPSPVVAPPPPPVVIAPPPPVVVAPPVVTPPVVTPPVVTPPPIAPPPVIFPAAPVATGLGSSSLTVASGLAPLSGSGSLAGSARARGPNMNEIYVTEAGTCGALNGRIASSGLCGLQAS
jgi:hypothetical protein